MNANTPDNPLSDRLAGAVRSLAVWDDQPPSLWQRALDATPTPRPAAAWPTLSKPLPGRLIAGIAACLVLVLGVGLMLPALGSARTTSAAFRDRALERLAEADRAPATGQPAPSQAFASTDDRSDPDLEPRRVIRSATMTLRTPDVRAAFLKAQRLVSDARGEYIAASQVKEVNGALQADITLRVDADRLDNVLNELRGIAEVIDEKIGADDVTEQVVDTDARLANERRTEGELIQLLESKQDADLDDILRLTAEIAKARERIERLTAQRDRLAGLVRLATVTIIIREPDREPAPRPPVTLLSRFVDDLSDAWHDGLRGLIASVTFLVRLLVSGAVWLGIIAIPVVIAYRKHRRNNPRSLPESL